VRHELGLPGYEITTEPQPDPQAPVRNIPDLGHGVPLAGWR